MLYSNEVRANERDVVNLAEHANNTGMINAGNKNSQQVSEKCWLFLEIERKGLVVAITAVSTRT